MAIGLDIVDAAANTLAAVAANESSSSLRAPTLLSASLAAAFYWPRRHIDLAPAPDGGLRFRMRGERFDDPGREYERVHRRLSQSVAG